MFDFLPISMLLVGGAAGTLARYAVSLWFQVEGWSQTFPWGTFAINVSGSFILGAVFVAINPKTPPTKLW